MSSLIGVGGEVCVLVGERCASEPGLIGESGGFGRSVRDERGRCELAENGFDDGDERVCACLPVRCCGRVCEECLSETMADVTPVEDGDVRFIRLRASKDRTYLSVVELRSGGCSKRLVIGFWEKQVVVPGSSLVVVFDEPGSVRSFRVVLVVNLHLDRNPGVWILNENVGSPVMVVSELSGTSH